MKPMPLAALAMLGQMGLDIDGNPKRSHRHMFREVNERKKEVNQAKIAAAMDKRERKAQKMLALAAKGAIKVHEPKE